MIKIFMIPKTIRYCIAGFLGSLCFFAGSPLLLAAGDGNVRGKIIILPLKSQIDKAELFYLRRGFQQAERDGDVKVIIIDMDTPGGELRLTEEIISWMRSLSAEGIEICTYVNPRAQSAGAIICLASDKIFMAPGSRIGSAAPILIDPSGGIVELPESVQEKILSDTRALVRGVAKEKGYLPELGTAMVDNNVEVKIGDRIICAEGELLNLTADEAVEIIPPMETPLLAQAIVKDLDELITKNNWNHLERVTIKPHGAETLARWITLLAPLLMAAAFMGIYMEFKTPGFGVPGIVGLSCLVLYLFGHYIAGLAGKEDIALVVIGLVLIAVELFVLPGFGVCGVLGMAALIGGIIMSMIPHLPKVPELPTGTLQPLKLEPFLNQAILNLSATIVITAVGVYLLAKILPKTPLYSQLVLAGSASVETGYIGMNIERNNDFLGQTGITVTPLRPAGTIRIGEKRVNVVSNGDYIDPEENVIVTEVQGARIIVDRMNEVRDPCET